MALFGRIGRYLEALAGARSPNGASLLSRAEVNLLAQDPLSMPRPWQPRCFLKSA